MKRNIISNLPVLVLVTSMVVIGIIVYPYFRPSKIPIVKPDYGPVLTLLGQTAQDGNFNFTASNMDCGVSKVGLPNPHDIQLLAQGQFCLARVKIENTSRKKQSLVADGHYLVSVDGKKYAPDLVGTSMVNDPWHEIERRESIEATIVFDIPKIAKPAFLELRATPSSEGVRIDLKKKALEH